MDATEDTSVSRKNEWDCLSSDEKSRGSGFRWRSYVAEMKIVWNCFFDKSQRLKIILWLEKFASNTTLIMQDRPSTRQTYFNSSEYDERNPETNNYDICSFLNNCFSETNFFCTIDSKENDLLFEQNQILR